MRRSKSSSVLTPSSCSRSFASSRLFASATVVRELGDSGHGARRVEVERQRADRRQHDLPPAAPDRGRADLATCAANGLGARLGRYQPTTCSSSSTTSGGIPSCADQAPGARQHRDAVEQLLDRELAVAAGSEHRGERRSTPRSARSASAASITASQSGLARPGSDPSPSTSPPTSTPSTRSAPS